ncbi:hypothetical protein [Psychroserpens sp. Hel_I_66]|uniref:hypothetical protein n=1 Tax=Psychroserpens sp. Hel_I_66 TaxID=1250004 RepID=UPI000647AD91|nr:hypothetical protein [Psychroserpens sp. Hel_I_66]
MKIKLLTLAILTFISCKNVNEKESEQQEINIDSTEIKSTSYEKKQKNAISNGIWISTIDSLSSVEIKGKKWIFKYKSVQTATDDYYEYLISESVFDKDSSLIGGTLVLTKQSNTLKYGIDYISDKNMDLIYLPRGNFQHFEKKE